MTARSLDMPRPARTAGLLYLGVIAAGITAEFAIRQPLIVAGDPAATAGNIAGNLGLFRAGFVLDTVMIAADIALAVTLFLLFRPVQPVVAALAAAFRLVQAAVLAAALMLHLAALMVVTGDVSGPVPSALFLLDLQAQAYDLGLIFFGLNTLLMAVLLCRAGAHMLAPMMAAAGLVYLAGSFARFLLPSLHPLLEPAYIVPLVAELSFAAWLLWPGRRL